jgi:arylsulfatase A-like enzyme
VAAAFGLLAACSAAPVRELELAVEAPFGERRGERREIFLDDTTALQPGDGWSSPELLPDGRTFRWAVGELSSFRFYCAEPRELELEISLRPFAGDGRPAQGVRCMVNGHDLGRHTFHSWAEVTFPVPAEVVAPGDNLVELVWDRATRPSEVRPSRDQRRLAAAVRYLAVGGLHDSAPEVAGGPKVVLTIGRASELRVAVHAGAGAKLVLRPQPGSDTPFEVWSRQDGEPFRRRCGPTARGRRVALENQEGPVEIALRAGLAGPVRFDRSTLRWRGAVAEAAELPSFEMPDVVLYVVDTLRADRLGCYGGPDGISPAIDGLASEGVLFERATAQSSWTKPSMVSVLGGLLTTEHGVRSREPVIPAKLTSVAESFEAAGYRTGAFTANAYLTRSAGFGRGFETFEFAHMDARTVTRRAVEWLVDGDDGRPAFLWVHTIDPHAPYEPGAAFRDRWAPGVAADVGTFAHLRSLAGRAPEVTAPFAAQYLALYDGEVAQNDAAFGELLQHLRASGRFDGACIVLTSDHGEEFWEHGVNGHGWDLFEEVLHVPLVVKPPCWRHGGKRVRRLVQHVDLAPTLLRIAGLAPVESAAGRDLFETTPVRQRVIFSEMLYEGRSGFAVRTDDLKLIEPLSRGFLPGRALFDLAADPGETCNLVEQRPVTAAWLAQEGRRLMSLLDRAPRSERSLEPSAEERRALEKLGYLQPVR